MEDNDTPQKRKAHLTRDQRMTIEAMLNKGLSFHEIAKAVNVHHSTISREVKSRRREENIGARGMTLNRCIHRTQCDKRQICMDRPDCLRRCGSCSRCNTRCPKFEEERCIHHLKAPYVCNGCHRRHACILRKLVYRPIVADKNYRETLKEARQGINTTEAELRKVDTILSNCLKQGQSLHHVYTHNRDLFTCSERTLYRRVNLGCFTAIRADLPRACSMRPRGGKPVAHKVDAKCQDGRRFSDYLNYITEHPDLPVTMMDSVIGTVGGKVLLTILFANSDMLLAFLREHNNARSVYACFVKIKELLAKHIPHLTLGKLFPIILTDNGSEFSDPKAIEDLDPGHIKVFYCDPGESNQKSPIERNHEFIRMILPKRTTFDNLTQDEIDLMLSHINSYGRPKHGDSCPFDIFTTAYTHGAAFLNALNIRKVSHNDIILKPRLLEENRKD